MTATFADVTTLRDGAAADPADPSATELLTAMASVPAGHPSRASNGVSA